MEAVIADTVQPGKFCVTMADHPPKITEDGGQTFRNLPGLDGYSGSTAAVMSEQTTSIICTGLSDMGERPALHGAVTEAAVRQPYFPWSGSVRPGTA